MNGSVKGRNSVMIGIRVNVSVNTILEEMAKKKGMTVSAFIKGKVEEYVRLASVHTNNGVNKNVLTDKEGRKYKLIGGRRFYLGDERKEEDVQTKG